MRRLFLGWHGVGKGSGLALGFLLVSKYFLRGVFGDGGNISSFFFFFVFVDFLGFGVGTNVGLGVGNLFSSLDLVSLLSLPAFSAFLFFWFGVVALGLGIVLGLAFLGVDVLIFSGV